MYSQPVHGGAAHVMIELVLHDEPTLAYVSDGAFISTSQIPVQGPDSQTLGSMSSPRRQREPERVLRQHHSLYSFGVDSFLRATSEGEAKASSC